MESLTSIHPSDQLIPIRDHEGQQAVSGRDLHSFLEVSRDYTTWFKKMTEYGLTEGQDFTPVRVESTGGRPGLDHALTLDAAKEIAMIQRTDKGKRARLYFIECEKRMKEKDALPDLTTPEGQLWAAERLAQTTRAAIEFKRRAEDSEQTVQHIESAAGITISEYHKHYFSDVPARKFFETLYRLGLLIDQRGTRVNKKGEKRDGHQHKHPSYKGKKFFYLYGRWDDHGIRREDTRVRPGRPELQCPASSSWQDFLGFECRGGGVGQAQVHLLGPVP